MSWLDVLNHVVSTGGKPRDFKFVGMTSRGAGNWISPCGRIGFIAWPPPATSEVTQWDCPNLDTFADGDQVWVWDAATQQPVLAIVAKWNNDTYWRKPDDPTFIPRPFELGMFWSSAKVGSAKSTGPVTCKRCNTINEFASPNQPDGSYTCYNCR